MKNKIKDPNLSRKGSIYGAWKTEFNDYVIVNDYVHCYLLIGEKSAMLIDTSYGQGDLPYFIRQLTDLPVIVVNTHGHTDHSGGNGFWPEVWMGHGAEIQAKSYKWLKRFPYPDYLIHFIEDGQNFDLGGRVVEAIKIEGHHNSSIAFLDKKTRSLYTGDEVESSQVLLFDHFTHTPTITLMTAHLQSMKKLRAKSAEYDRLIPSHNGAPLSIDYIDDFITLAEQYLAGKVKPEVTVAGYGMPTFLWGGDKKLSRIRYGRASYIIDKQQVPD